jgi:phenylalanyl-tRNA synthetase beta chain
MKFSYSLIKKLLPKVPPKAKLAEALNIYSFETENLPGDLLEISLPPNRYSDAASHIGVAREAAAVFGLKLVSPVKTIVNPPSDRGLLKVEVQNPKLCPRYIGRVFELKKSSASPPWLIRALETCGLKPINYVVDLMNYVMLEIGQPLHAFDADKLSNSSRINSNQSRIIIRRARRGEKIETLDGQKFGLDADTLVIAGFVKHSGKFDENSGVPIAIAGIKGGENSGVSRHTKKIIVEAANFDPVSIYKTSRKLKLATDASVRFSHGMSPTLAQIGMDGATELLTKAGAKLVDSADYYPRPIGEEVIEFDVAKYESVIGSPVGAEKAKKYFRLLGFETEKSKLPQNNKKFLVRIPPWRTDLEEIEDLVEEIARLEGYGKLKPKPPVVSLVPAHQEDIVILKDKVRSALINFQLDEVYNSSFIGGADLRGQHADLAEFFLRLSASGQRKSAFVEVENPISEDKKFLRPSLLHLLLKNVKENARFYDAVRIFEIGKVFGEVGSKTAEKLLLGIALAAKKDTKLILEMKGLADEFLKSLGVDDFSIVASGEDLRVESDHKILGFMKQVHLEKGWIAALGEFDLEKIMEFTEEGKEYAPLNIYPAVIRDISVLIDSEVRIGDVLQEIQDSNPILIENVDLVDEYVNEKLGGRQSLTFRIVFQAKDRTLTDAEVNREMEKISKTLKGRFKAEIR